MNTIKAKQFDCIVCVLLSIVSSSISFTISLLICANQCLRTRQVKMVFNVKMTFRKVKAKEFR